MARPSTQDGQLSFDIDALLHAADVEAALPWRETPLHFTMDYFAPAELDAAFEHWCFLNGHFDSIARSHLWHRLVQLREHVELGEHSIDTFTADLGCATAQHRDLDENCSCVGGLIVQAICEPCGWHALADNENAAVEGWRDHAIPGWRKLPIVPARIRVRNEKGLTKQAQEWIADNYPLEIQVPGVPIITKRSRYATRHVPNYSPWGGYDLSHKAVAAKRRTNPQESRRHPGLTLPEPATSSRHSRDRGLGF